MLSRHVQNVCWGWTLALLALVWEAVGDAVTVGSTGIVQDWTKGVYSYQYSYSYGFDANTTIYIYNEHPDYGLYLHTYETEAFTNEFQKGALDITLKPGEYITATFPGVISSRGFFDAVSPDTNGTETDITMKNYYWVQSKALSSSESQSSFTFIDQMGHFSCQYSSSYSSKADDSSGIYTGEQVLTVICKEPTRSSYSYSFEFV